MAENLIKEQLLCVCSPEYKKKSKIKNVSDLAFGDLLNNSSRPMIWENYFKFLGLKEKDLSLKYHSNFEHLFMITEAPKYWQRTS